MRKIDNSLVDILSTQSTTTALVRVKSPLQMGYIYRHFNVVKEYPFIRSVGVECDINDVRYLSMRNDVEFVSAQSKVSAFGDFNALDSQNIDKYMDIDFAKDTELNGQGVRLCVMDTGISPHCDLCIPRDRIVEFVDLVNEYQYPYDDNGHGTFVAGVAVGNGLLSGRNIGGIAPQSEVVGLKVITSKGESGTFKILDGMQWLYDNFRRLNIKVVCMSFGAEPSEYADPLKIGAEMLVRSGLIVVCAVGNSGENNLKSPAISDEVISVGAVDDNMNIAGFSSRGVYNGIQRPDLYTYGVNIRGLDNQNCYSYMSGTSVSAPAITGVCCLICQKYKNITPYQVKRILKSNCISKNGVLVFDIRHNNILEM